MILYWNDRDKRGRDDRERMRKSVTLHYKDIQLMTRYFLTRFSYISLFHISSCVFPWLFLLSFNLISDLVICTSKKVSVPKISILSPGFYIETRYSYFSFFRRVFRPHNSEQMLNDQYRMKSVNHFYFTSPRTFLFHSPLDFKSQKRKRGSKEEGLRKILRWNKRERQEKKAIGRYSNQILLRLN